MVESISSQLPGWRQLEKGFFASPISLHQVIGSVKGIVTRILSHIPPSFHLAILVRTLAEVAGRPDWTSIEELDVPRSHGALSYSIDDYCFNLLLRSDPEMRLTALAYSSSLTRAGDWLNDTSYIYLIASYIYLLALYLLGLRMVGEDDSPCLVFQARADGYGDHQVGCGGNGYRIHRLDSIYDALFAAQLAAVVPRREAPSLITDK